ncbi:MAG: SDR family NAD(P)-dependent oxidoreductase [bacterium]|nr:short-chain dehydrogenase [Deltaproteobacteria bacterium]MCP4904039.1 SDR family NAD(P)-dependent oxidoreductase [bacterium]
MMTAVVLGGTSGIGEALARELAAQGLNVVLAGRDLAELDARARDLEIRYGVRAWSRPFDALDFESHHDWLESCEREIGEEIGGVALCYGVMPSEDEAAVDGSLTRHMIEINYSSAVSILDRVAERLRDRGKGFICAITSVAGDRGRASNFHYGSSKAALSTYLSGLRVQMARDGVSVVDIRPGMIDTKLTYGLPGLMMLAKPRRVARDIVRGIRGNRAVVYTPKIWWLVMFVIRMLPDFIFRRIAL